MVCAVNRRAHELPHLTNFSVPECIIRRAQNEPTMGGRDHISEIVYKTKP